MVLSDSSEITVTIDFGINSYIIKIMFSFDSFCYSNPKSKSQCIMNYSKEEISALPNYLLIIAFDLALTPGI